MGCLLVALFLVVAAAFALAIAWGVLPFAVIVLVVTGVCILIGYSTKAEKGAVAGLVIGLLLSALSSYLFFQHGWNQWMGGKESVHTQSQQQEVVKKAEANYTKRRTRALTTYRDVSTRSCKKYAVPAREQQVFANHTKGERFTARCFCYQSKECQGNEICRNRLCYPKDW